MQKSQQKYLGLREVALEAMPFNNGVRGTLMAPTTSSLLCLVFYRLLGLVWCDSNLRFCPNYLSLISGEMLYPPPRKNQKHSQTICPTLHFCRVLRNWKTIYLLNHLLFVVP
uniref:Uncharacterized protein n=1 Tax=Opuntia streptacantha TaxID=393608 RepID=A0A7C9CKE2_OPUST